MGKALIIKVYKIVADTPNIDIDILLRSDSSYSLAIMDNNFYYGDYKIVANKLLTVEEIEPPISYGRSISV